MNTGDGAFIGVDVEITDRMVNELVPLMIIVLRLLKIRTYRCRVFVEKHSESRKMGLFSGKNSRCGKKG